MMNPFSISLDSDVTVHLKRIPDDIREPETFATDEDMRDISEIKSVSRRAEILATRQLVRELFPAHPVISHHADGSPYLDGFPGYISISHCHGLVAVASHPRLKIGIDIERWRNTLLRVKDKYLSHREMEHYSSPDRMLFAWTAKEAVYKAAGCSGIDFANGISLPLDAVGNIATVHHNDTSARFRLYSGIVSGATVTVAVPAIP